MNEEKFECILWMKKIHNLSHACNLVKKMNIQHPNKKPGEFFISLFLVLILRSRSAQGLSHQQQHDHHYSTLCRFYPARTPQLRQRGCGARNKGPVGWRRACPGQSPFKNLGESFGPTHSSGCGGEGGGGLIPAPQGERVVRGAPPISRNQKKPGPGRLTGRRLRDGQPAGNQCVGTIVRGIWLHSMNALWGLYNRHGLRKFRLAFEIKMINVVYFVVSVISISCFFGKTQERIFPFFLFQIRLKHIMFCLPKKIENAFLTKKLTSKHSEMDGIRFYIGVYSFGQNEHIKPLSGVIFFDRRGSCLIKKLGKKTY